MKKILFIAMALGISMGAMAQNSIRLIRNATLRISYAGKEILVDPMLGEKGKGFSVMKVNNNPRVNLVMPVSEILDGVDFSLLTHTHFDHYDSVAIHTINKDMRWYIQPEDEDIVARRDGFRRAVPVTDSITTDGITIIRIHGHHGRGKVAEKFGPSSGYVLRAGGQPTVYVMGDCVWEEETQQAVSKYRPDYIVMNTGGNIALPLSQTDGPLIMDEMEAVRMIKECSQTTRFIAVHMDAVDHCQTSRSILRNQAEHDHIDMNRLFIPEDGETIMIR